MNKTELAIPEKDPKEEDQLEEQSAEDEEMVKEEWQDEELINMLNDDLLSGSTPG